MAGTSKVAPALDVHGDFSSRSRPSFQQSSPSRAGSCCAARARLQLLLPSGSAASASWSRWDICATTPSSSSTASDLELPGAQPPSRWCPFGDMDNRKTWLSFKSEHTAT